jgi:tetratricopeptide (TPR) repeat protein
LLDGRFGAQGRPFSRRKLAPGKVGVKVKVKSSGQECPLHTGSRVASLLLRHGCCAPRPLAYEEYPTTRLSPCEYLASGCGLGYNTRMSCLVVHRFGSLLAFVLLSCFPSPAQVPEVPTDVKPQTVTPDEGEKKPDYSKEGYVIEQARSRFRFESDGRGREENSVRVRVQSEAGVQHWGQLRFGYNSANEKLDIAYVRVLKADGTVVTAGPDAVQDINGSVQQLAPVYTDYREKHVSVPGLRPGDVLECGTVNVIHTPLAPGQFWMQHDFNQESIVLDEQLEVDIPAERTAKVKNKPGMDAKITEENGRRIYRWSSNHLVQEDEGKDKDKDKDKDGKDKKKKKKKNADQVADVQMTTFSSWEEVGRWYAGLEKDRRAPSKEVRAKAAELTKGMDTDLGKTEALYDFVAKNFRYVSLSLGLARYQPQAAGDVLHNQYGDCKDKNTLLAALLEAEGLHSSTVLIHTLRKLDPEVPSPSQFNHAITMLTLGKEEIWMDTTTEVAPFRLLSYSIRKKQGLVIPPGGVAHLEETPADPPMRDTEVEEIEGKVDESGRLEARVTETLRGDSELLARMAFRNTPTAKWQVLVEAINKGLGGDVSGVKVGDPAATRESFVISYDVSKANFIDWSKKKLELRLPLSTIGLVAIGKDVGEEEAEDAGAGGEATKAEPFKLGPPNDHIYKIKLELAARYTAKAPVAVKVERDYGGYQSSYKVEGNIFTAERKLILRQGELPPARADDYRAFRQTVLADTGQHLTIESAVADTHTIPAGMKAEDLIRSGNEARKNGNYTLAINLLNRAVEADAKSKNGWNDLGLAYLEDWQDGLAINAFQKQIEVNAYDLNAYNNLGRVYLRQRKYEEAEKWFNKQIEIQPLDKYAHENLGIAYLESHKYEEAVPELEKAATITPDNAEAQVRVGEVYLNVGQDAKAMEAFDKAVRISATPNVWNRIAYRLAQKSAHLDLARRYAESAVSSTATRLRNLNLEQIKQNDLGLTNALGSFWDTLGWVAFAEGHLDVAKKYVLPAWELGERGEEADHLGQICEKSGDKEGAVRWYALALSGRRPEVETRGRLAALAGGGDKVEALVEKHSEELERLRTVTFKSAVKQDGRAEFFVLLGGTGDAGVTIEDVKFVSGSEGMKDVGDAIRGAKYSQRVPDETPVKILRRGKVSCMGGECRLVLALAEDVRSVD